MVLKHTSFTFTSLTKINDTVINGDRDDNGEHKKGEKNTFFGKESVMDYLNITRYGRWIRRFEEDVMPFRAYNPRIGCAKERSCKPCNFSLDSKFYLR
jgi:hypothetical protein